jgi:hypothetical protein
MVHREFRRERSLWRKLGLELLFAAGAAAVFSVLFVLGDLAVYGHVRW